MRPTGEASRPVSGGLVCGLFRSQPALRHPDLRQTSQSLGSGFVANTTVTGRFRKKEASRFRAIIQVLFFPDRLAVFIRQECDILMARGLRRARVGFPQDPDVRRQRLARHW